MSIQIVQLYPNENTPPPFHSEFHEFPWQAQWYAIAKGKTPHREVYGIYFHHQLVGGMVLDTHRDLPELVYFEILRAYRGRGFGRRALCGLLNMLRKRGYRYLFVQTGRPQIYAGMGFQFEVCHESGLVIATESPWHPSVLKKLHFPALIFHEAFMHHHRRNAPETPDRVRAIWDTIRRIPEFPDLTIRHPLPATSADLTRVHPTSYLQALESACHRYSVLGPNSRTDPSTYSLARLAFGAAMNAGEWIERWNRIFVLSRPPAHHALPDRPMGFCFLNHTAALALKLFDLGYRPMVIDWDAHHGNGIQDILYDKPILFVSIHQSSLFPETGHPEERGTGEGIGYNYNLPVPPLCTDEQFQRQFIKIWDIADTYRPTVLIVAAGQDGHREEKISGMLLSDDCYVWMTQQVIDLANAYCAGRCIFILEGGYEPSTQARLTVKILRVLCQQSPAGTS